MKSSFSISHLIVWAVPVFLILFFTACEETDYDLLDPDSAGVWELYNASNSGLPGNQVWDIDVDPQGSLWLSCYGAGLAKLSDKTWTKYNTSNSAILSNYVTAIETTSDGKVIVGTNNGLAILNSSGVWSSYKDPLVTTMEINSVRATSDGLLWVGTSNEGLYINEATVYAHSTSGFSVYAFEEDKAGNVWMGANTGLFLWNGTTWKNITATSELPDGEVTSLFIDSRERVWIGVLNADKVYWYDKDGAHGLSLLTGGTGLEVWDICEDRNGDIWFATYGSGLIRYDGVVPHAYKKYNADYSEVFAEDKVNCIVKDKEGNMWFGLTTKGLVKYTLPIK